MEVIGLDACLSAIENELNAIAARGRASLKLAGQAYANDVKALAPLGTDPKTAPHGTYRRSIHVEAAPPGEDYVLVGTDLPQARRLEFGFYDMVDSLGRHYYQLPRPHFRPPLDTEMSRYLDIMHGSLSGSGSYDRSAGLGWAGSVLGGIRPDLLSGVFTK